MPHKHKRKSIDPSHHDLPPSVTHARPLPTSQKPAAPNAQRGAKKDRKPAKEDDTPKSFTRLLQRRQHIAQSRTRPHVPATTKPTVKRKRNNDPSTTTQSAETEPLRLQPNERLADFNARVNLSLPISGLVKHGEKAMSVGGKLVKAPQSKTEKRMQRMQAAWRAEAARRNEKEEEAADEREVEEVGREGFSVSAELEGVGTRKRRREDDPWAILEKRRERGRFGEVVERPPELGRWVEKLKGKKAPRTK